MVIVRHLIAISANKYKLNAFPCVQWQQQQQQQVVADSLVLSFSGGHLLCRRYYML